MTAPELLIRNGEVDGISGVDVAVRAGVVVEVGRRIEPAPGVEVLDARGGAVLPGLHDHHLHLRSLAAARSSVQAGPPHVDDEAQLGAALGKAAARTSPDGWIRAVGYHESVAGALDASHLDALMPDLPLRVQHRSGVLWILNTAALRITGFGDSPDPGVERDRRGAPTGRLWRMDRELSRRVPPVPIDYRALSAAAARRGVTGFTDADPERTERDVADLGDAVDRGTLVQRLHLMGPPGLRVEPRDRLTLGPLKMLLDDARLPALDELSGTVRAAREERRTVAVHCATRVQLALTLTAFKEAGTVPGDRIEHASVAPPELAAAMARLGLTVVTQPHFVAERGDQYLSDVDPDDVPHLYPCRSLLEHGIGVAGGTDAPYGSADPWRAIAAATSRTTARGAVVGPGERITGPQAVHLFLGRPEAPASLRCVRSGAPADLCVLGLPLAEALREPSSEHVAATLVGGEVVAGPER